MKFKLEPHHRDVPNDTLIADLKRVAEAKGRNSVTTRTYNELGKYHSSTLMLRFGSWTKALALAGLKPSINRNIPHDELFQNLVTVWLFLGTQPKFRDMTDKPSVFSPTTYANRFGSWRKALEHFVD